MFWKKKESTPVQPAVQSPVKETATRYHCLGINYLDVIEIDGENLDEVKEELFAKFQQVKKIYTKVDIQKMTDLLGYDIWRSFIWIDSTIPQMNILKSQTMSIKERWLGLKDFDSDELLVDTNEALAGKLNKQDFYNRVQIQNVAQEVGFDVYNRSNWESYFHRKIDFTDRNLSFEYYKKSTES